LSAVIAWCPIDRKHSEEAIVRSRDRILTTHTGSLPRPREILALLAAGEGGTPIADAAFERQTTEAVRDIVRRQQEIGIDLINDGEQSKPDYSTYIKNRLNGFDGDMEIHPVSRDARDFPEYFTGNRAGSLMTARPCCTGPISWRDREAVDRDIARFKAALEAAAISPDNAFMTAVSPGQAARFLGNRYYRTHEDYLRALAAILRDEYDAIVAAGLTLQVDCPDLASGWNNQFAECTLAEFRDVVRLHLRILDEALRDVPPERIRLHLCWGNYAGPHNHDIPLGDIIDLVLASRATMISFEGANPRHEHEWRVFEEVRLPDGKVIIPGVLDSVSNAVEHPRVVADRIVRFANVVGRERVIAGTDCGFATFAASAIVHPTIAWAKLRSLTEGARLASEELWR
jgi:5-methyltetrahydropteroyltriglutamate--homocysteine methyltransferase